MTAGTVRGRRLLRFLPILAALFLLLMLRGPAWVILKQALLAVLLCQPVLPLCRALEKRCSRPVSAALSIGALFLALAVILLMLIPQLVYQVTLIFQNLPALLAALQGLLRRVQELEWVKKAGVTLNAPEQFLLKAGAWAGERLPDALSFAARLIDGASRAVLAPVLAYYFLRDREMFLFRLSLLIPEKRRSKTLRILKSMRREAMYFVRGQLLVAACVFLLTALGLLLVGLPAWLALGLIMGFCELIPYVGPLIGAIPIALFSLPIGLDKCFWSLLVAFAVQQAEGLALSPRLMGGATGLHPAWVLMLLTFGGLVGGVMGMVLTLPIFLALRAALRVLSETREETLERFERNTKRP